MDDNQPQTNPPTDASPSPEPATPPETQPVQAAQPVQPAQPEQQTTQPAPGQPVQPSSTTPEAAQPPAAAPPAEQSAAPVEPTQAAPVQPAQPDQPPQTPPPQTFTPVQNADQPNQDPAKLKKSITKAILAVVSVSVIGGLAFFVIGQMGGIDLANREVITEDTYSVEVPIGWEREEEGTQVYYTKESAVGFKAAAVMVATEENVYPEGTITILKESGEDEEQLIDSFVEGFVGGFTSNNNVELKGDPTVTIDEFSTEQIKLSMEMQATDTTDDTEISLYADVFMLNDGKMAVVFVGVADDLDADVVEINEIIDSFNFN
ncbi:TPA: hypothetical protein EYO12_03020 [Candidatus Saccharibacteria bacterium]|nr:hypothetical protein [Candidatus Saccharibacteria bacterium]HIO87993.1 hypothetical protein [Candidatus Saccharibacteria bacterium]